MKKNTLLTAILGIVAIWTVFLAVKSYDNVLDKLGLVQNEENQGDVSSEDNNSENTENPVLTKEPEVSVAPNPVAPVLTLKQDRVEIVKDDEFDIFAQIKEITDDKDSQETLLESVEVFGLYNRSVPGKYVLEYVATDSDGHKSISKTLTLVVKEK